MSSHPTSKKTAVGWLPFQCPSCFCLFRAKHSDVGELGRCPGCEARLLIAGIEKKEVETARKAPAPVSPSMSAYAQAKVSEAKVEEVSSEWDEPTKKRKRFFGDQSDTIGWEEEAAEAKSKPGGLSWTLMISVFMMGALAVVGGIRFINSRAVSGGGQSDDLLQRAESLIQEQSSRNESMTAAKAQEDEETRKLIEKFDQFDPVKIRQAVESFLSAETYEEKAKFCREGQAILPKMKSFYEGESLKDEGFRSLDQTRLVYRGDFISTFVRLSDFLDYPIVIERVSEEQYVVDWESWVGYGEKKVSELILTRPTEPVEIRVIATFENYYNYSFSDDKEWLSLKLSFRNQERTLWGYVGRDSDLGRSIKIYSKQLDSHPLRLKIKYPENARARDQVIVTEVLGDGWVDMTPAE